MRNLAEFLTLFPKWAPECRQLCWAGRMGAECPDPQPCLHGGHWFLGLDDTLIWAGISFPSLFRSCFGSTGMGAGTGISLHPWSHLCWEPGLCQVYPW